MPFVVTIVISVAAKQLKAGCCFNAIEIYSIQTREQSVMLWENKKIKKKTFTGLLDNI